MVGWRGKDGIERVDNVTSYPFTLLALHDVTHPGISLHRQDFLLNASHPTRTGVGTP